MKARKDLEGLDSRREVACENRQHFIREHCFCGTDIVFCFVISQLEFPDEEKDEKYLFSRDFYKQY